MFCGNCVIAYGVLLGMQHICDNSFYYCIHFLIPHTFSLFPFLFYPLQFTSLSQLQILLSSHKLFNSQLTMTSFLSTLKVPLLQFQTQSIFLILQPSSIAIISIDNGYQSCIHANNNKIQFSHIWPFNITQKSIQQCTS